LSCENTIETRFDHKDEPSLIADVRCSQPSCAHWLEWDILHASDQHTALLKGIKGR